MASTIPAHWAQYLCEVSGSQSFAQLQSFIKIERSEYQVFPSEENTYAALELTPLQAVRAVILGQDPYHEAGQAHGLAFSVPNDVRRPPSLVNVLKEWASDLDTSLPQTSRLDRWAASGVLLLNTVLTVRAHKANSHQGKGWEQLTDAVISAVSAQERPVAFILWGASAQSKLRHIDQGRHAVILSPHPSPLSAHKGFFGSRPFTRTNVELARRGQPPVDWHLE